MYHKVEKRLREYNFLKIYLESLYEKRKLLELEYGAVGISYDNPSIQSNKIGNTTESMALNLLEQREDIEYRIKKTAAKLNHIDKAIDNLMDLEKEIINLFYFKNKKMWEVGSETHCSSSKVKRVRRNAINKLIVALYGEK